MFGIPNDVAMQAVAAGFIIAADSCETALNFETIDALFIAAACMAEDEQRWRRMPCVAILPDGYAYQFAESVLVSARPERLNGGAVIFVGWRYAYPTYGTCGLPLIYSPCWLKLPVLVASKSLRRSRKAGAARMDAG